MFYIRTADRLQRTAAWIESLDGGLDHLRSVIVDDCAGHRRELDEAMARHVGVVRGRMAGGARRPAAAGAASSRSSTPPARLTRPSASSPSADSRVPPDPRVARSRAWSPDPYWQVVRRAMSTSLWTSAEASLVVESWTDGLPLPRSAARTRRGGADRRVQVALFRTFDRRPCTRSATIDPFTGAYVLSRGIVGSRGDVPDRRVPAAQAGLRPAYRRPVSTTRGRSVRVPTYDVRSSRRHGGGDACRRSVSRMMTAEAGIEPLAGFTIGITAARRREEFGAALERRGADGRVRTSDPHRAAGRRQPSCGRDRGSCLVAPLDIVVATTGIGFRGWMEAADAWGLAERADRRLRQRHPAGPRSQGARCDPRERPARRLVPGVGVLERGPRATSSTRTTWTGKRIAVQLHGEPLPDVVQTLRAAGAEVIEVPVYRWVPPEDQEPLNRLLQSVVSHGVDAVAFTSAPAAVSFLRTADNLGLGQEVRAALRTSVLPAGVGPVTAGPLQREDITVVQPPRARLGSLVRTLVEQVPVRCGSVLPVAGHVLEVRGHAVMLDSTFSPLSGTAMVMLRALMRRPGQVVSRGALLAALPGEGCDEHAVEVAIGRLRTALGDPRCVQTVVKRGYRLAYDPDRAGSCDPAKGSHFEQHG